MKVEIKPFETMANVECKVNRNVYDVFIKRNKEKTYLCYYLKKKGVNKNETRRIN